MLKPHAAALTGGLLGALALLLGTSASVFSETRPNRSAWQEKFRRPAEIPFPASNPYSEAKSKLGRTLFFDPILSGSKARSCASCHNPGLSWADGQPRAGNYPTWAWSPGEQVVDTWTITLPAGLKPGDYQVVTGFYKPATGERIPILEDGQPAPNNSATVLRFTLK